MEPVLKIHVIIDLVKPLFQALNALLMVFCAGYAFYSYRRRSDFLMLLIIAGATIGAFIVAVYLMFSLQTGWKITLLPVDVRRWLHVAINVLYPLELIIWPTILVTVAYRNLKRPPTILNK